MAPSTTDTGTSKRVEKKVHLFNWRYMRRFPKFECLFLFLESATGSPTATPREEEREAKETSSQESSGSQ
jgi:hypothetical protein